MWSYVLAAIGVTGIFFVGRKTIWGWLVLLLNECLWIIYAVTTKQYGFIFAAIAYGIVYISRKRCMAMKNLIKSIVCRFKDHTLIAAGSCPFTGRTYNLCTRCTAMIPVESLE
jgi:hypothetical protein